MIHNVSPAYVLVEGSADFNDRIDELLLGHRLPIALFSFLTGPNVHRMIWAPFCDYSPEWVALTTAKAVGAEFRFIDLPAWHNAFEERTNRYSDADARHIAVTSRLCAEFGMDNNDVLWDHLVEVPGAEYHTLARYFDTLRGDARGGDSDAAREEYMAQWICAAKYFARGRPIVVVTGGFHRPALVSLTAERDDLAQWPAVPPPPEGHRVGNYLIPYSYRRLDAFSGYQSGMPSPGYYHHVWHDSAEAAGQRLIADVAGRLRERHVPVSTADLIAAQSLSEGLARLRGHPVRARTDILDGLAAALITEDLPAPLPWAARGVLQTGTHPAVLEMLAALTGTAHGELHPDTPLPPLVPDVGRLLAEHDLTPPREVRLTLTVEADLDRSRILNCLRVLGIPGFERISGPPRAPTRRPRNAGHCRCGIPNFPDFWRPAPMALPSAPPWHMCCVNRWPMAARHRPRSAGHCSTLCSAAATRCSASSCPPLPRRSPTVTTWAGSVPSCPRCWPCGATTGSTRSATTTGFRRWSRPQHAGSSGWPSRPAHAHATPIAAKSPPSRPSAMH
ncbi:hypothetical protein L830_1482 [Mycobacteroides abscessus MAB_082312_2258]|nr:hypothetical protein L830_1482 [Mycobacteroides abscessus MAB_082312_2258]